VKGEVEMVTRMASQPCLDRRGLVGGVIVEHEVEVEIGGHRLFDRVEELTELDRAVALVAAANDPSGGDVERGKQRGGAVADIVVAAPLGLSRPHRQQGLGTVQRLDLRLLVDAQHQGVLGRGQIEPDDIAPLSINSGSADNLKVSMRCGCKPKARQIRPTLKVERPLVTRHAARAEKAPAPLSDSLLGDALARRHHLVAQSGGATQHDPGPRRQGLRRLPPAPVALEHAPILRRQIEPAQRPSRPHNIPPRQSPNNPDYDANLRFRTLV
jgi:hypothetical protein